jgi:hypothetical protein
MNKLQKLPSFGLYRNTTVTYNFTVNELHGQRHELLDRRRNSSIRTS